MSGIGKQLRGSGIARPGVSSIREGFKKGGSAKIGAFLQTMGEYKNLAKSKELHMKKGGSAKPGLWANINRRKKLGISRPKSKSTISAKAYANMKAGFPKKK
jgi:hypothetical protein